MRHIISLSGGKDSTALACGLIKDQWLGPLPFELVFTDTKEEPPQLYPYLDRVSAYLNTPIFTIPGPSYAEELQRNGGVLPAPWARWCTDKLKIRPFNKWIGDSEATLYLGIRADEPWREHEGTRRKATVKRYPFIERGIDREGVSAILKSHGLSDNPIYKLKARSGCACCFFQPISVWKRLAQMHPEKFALYKQWEQQDIAKNPAGEKTFTFGWFRLANIEAQEEMFPLDCDMQDHACQECVDD